MYKTSELENGILAAFRQCNYRHAQQLLEQVNHDESSDAERHSSLFLHECLDEFDDEQGSEHTLGMVISTLIRYGYMSDNRTSDGVSPLLKAASNGMYEVAAILIAAGADVNSEDAEGFTPLLASIQRATEDHEQSGKLVRLLLLNGASKTIDCPGDGGGKCMTPLGLAATNLMFQTTQDLLDFGCNILALDYDKRTVFDRLAAMPKNEGVVEMTNRLRSHQARMVRSL